MSRPPSCSASSPTAAAEPPSAAHAGAEGLPIRLREQDPNGALADAARLGSHCPSDRRQRALRALALGANGRLDDALREARAGLDEGGDAASLHYALALIYVQQGDVRRALTEAGASVEAGGGRDARLLASMAAIRLGDWDGAERWLVPALRAHPVDSPLQYNLALVADKGGDTNRAREGYLAALRADPHNAEARYNVALLCW